MSAADEKDEEEEEGLLKPGEVLDGRYRIEKELGRGGIGVVYKAYDLENHIYDAIKMLLEKWAKDRKMVARFLREGRLAIRAQHPYIVLVREIRKRNGTGTPYIVMEYVEGVVLLDRLKAARDRGQKIGVAFLPLARQLASVLAACHARNIVHRDLKPANIMVVKNDDVVGGELVKLLDFGIAKMFSDDEDGTQTSVGDQQPGTPAYMAPEQLSTLEKDADPAKMDVYALGVILYQCLAGKLPLYSPNRIGMMSLLMYSEPEPLLTVDPSLPPELAQLVHEMLAKDPKKRPTMEQVRERLKSRAEVLNVRPTMEIDALVPAPVSESGLSQTADEPVQNAAQSTAPPVLNTPVKSVGDRRTEPQPSELLELSSAAARATGQQITGAETRHRRRRQRLWIAAALGGAALVAGIATFSVRKLLPPLPSPTPQIAATAPSMKMEPVAPPTKPDPQPAPSPSPSSVTVKEAAPAVHPAPVDAGGKPSKAGKCTATEPTTACIASTVSADMRKSIMAALRDADVKLCPGDRLTISGVEATLKVGHAPKSVPAGIQKDLVFSLRSHLHGAALPGEVEIRCKR